MKYCAVMVKNPKELGRYAEKWAALCPKTKKILAAAKTPKQALALAREKGEADPILTRIPKRFDSYVL